MLRRLYDWTLSLAAHKHALLALALIALIESSIFPIPPDILIIPMVLAARDRAWVIAGVCTVASVIGGVFGYGIGFFLFEQIGKPVLEFYHYAAKFGEFQETYNDWGAWAVFFAGITPFPYKVITILSGVTGLNMPVFIIASILARGLRFFIVAALLWKFGDPIRAFIERRLGLLFILFCVMLVGGFVLVKYLL
ncbi:MAG: VTT domain-containing protein [Rhodospirillales bacterium]|jgi:membrane protein YqaA with SNARE-associated domain